MKVYSWCASLVRRGVALKSDEVYSMLLLWRGPQPAQGRIQILGIVLRGARTTDGADGGRGDSGG